MQQKVLAKKIPGTKDCLEPAGERSYGFAKIVREDSNLRVVCQDKIANYREQYMTVYFDDWLGFRDEVMLLKQYYSRGLISSQLTVDSWNESGKE